MIIVGAHIKHDVSAKRNCMIAESCMVLAAGVATRTGARIIAATRSTKKDGYRENLIVNVVVLASCYIETLE